METRVIEIGTPREDGCVVIDWDMTFTAAEDVKLDRTPIPGEPGGVFIATGHAKYGLAYGPITGRIASECILDGKPSLDISSMRADRF